MIQKYFPGGLFKKVASGFSRAKSLRSDISNARQLTLSRQAFDVANKDWEKINKRLLAFKKMDAQMPKTNLTNIQRLKLSAIDQSLKNTAKDLSDAVKQREALRDVYMANLRSARNIRDLKRTGMNFAKNAAALGVAGGIGYYLGDDDKLQNEIPLSPQEDVLLPEDFRLKLADPDAIYLDHDVRSSSQGIVIDPVTGLQMVYLYDPKYSDFYTALAGKYGINTADVRDLLKRLGVTEDGLFGPNTERVYLLLYL